MPDLVDRRPGDPPLPPDLQDAVDEWVAMASAITRAGRAEELELLSRRGKQLATRLAAVLGRPVEFTDPVDGAVESVVVAPEPSRAEDAAGPVPWATGLAVSAFCAIFVGFADIVLCEAFAAAFGPLWIPANLLVCSGLAPTLWLVRRLPLWRWFAYGAAAGLLVAWLVLMLASLAP